jgi:cell division transport system permease protein
MSLVLAAYGARHVQAFLAALGRLARNPFSTFLTLIVIALALVLPLGLELLVTNARIATGGFANAIDLSVYFKTEVPLA